jgi:hypothetical protein
VRKPTPHDYYALFNALEACAELWVARPAQGERFGKLMKEMLPYARSYGKRFVVGQPRLEIFLGLYAWLGGERTRAFEHWAKAEYRAQALKIPYDVATAQYWMARAGHTDRERLLTSAHDIFIRLGASWDGERSKALDKPGEG